MDLITVTKRTRGNRRFWLSMVKPKKVARIIEGVKPYICTILFKQA